MPWLETDKPIKHEIAFDFSTPLINSNNENKIQPRNQKSDKSKSAGKDEE